MVQLETQLGAQFIDGIRIDVSKNKERIKCCKIHGGEYQSIGISDWLIWYKGYSIGIEFKVYPNRASEAQLNFLQDIIECGSTGLIIIFNDKWKSMLTPLEVIDAAINRRNENYNRIIFENYGYTGKSITLPKLST